jgi:hypothetical protein
VTTRRAGRLRRGGGGQAQAAAQAGYHPYGDGATPMVAPAAALGYQHVQDYPWGSSGVASYQELDGMWAADGGWIAGVPPRPPGNVRRAGRP